MSYILKMSKRDKPMYYRDNRLISVRDIPQVVLSQLQPGIPFDYKVEPPQEIPKDCLFCGAPAKLTRIVNGYVVVLCHDHFYSETIGRIAQKLREKEIDKESENG